MLTLAELAINEESVANSTLSKTAGTDTEWDVSESEVNLEAGRHRRERVNAGGNRRTQAGADQLLRNSGHMRNPPHWRGDQQLDPVPTQNKEYGRLVSSLSKSVVRTVYAESKEGGAQRRSADGTQTFRDFLQRNAELLVAICANAYPNPECLRYACSSSPGQSFRQ